MATSIIFLEGSIPINEISFFRCLFCIFLIRDPYKRILSHFSFQMRRKHFGKMIGAQANRKIKKNPYLLIENYTDEQIIDLIQNHKSQIFYFLSKDQSFLINSPNKESQGNIINLTWFFNLKFSIRLFSLILNGLY